MFTGITKYLIGIFFFKYFILNSTIYNFFFVKINFLNFLDIFSGDSISLQGICFTLIYKNYNFLEFEVSPESSKFIYIENTFWFNLEKCLKLTDKINANFVLGHINNLLILIKKKQNDLYILFYKVLYKYLVYKSSINLNGVNLTINKVFCFNFYCVIFLNIINYTYYNTNIYFIKTFSFVLIELDVFSYYILNIIVCI